MIWLMHRPWHAFGWFKIERFDGGSFLSYGFTLTPPCLPMPVYF